MSTRTESRLPTGLLIAAGVALLSAGCAPESVEPEEAVEDEAHIRGHIAGRVAHHLCAGVFVVGRDYERTVEEVVAQDLEPFDELRDDFRYGVDFETRTASVSGDGFGTRSAEYNGDQGCTILPVDLEDVTYEPQVVERLSPWIAVCPPDIGVQRF